MKPLIVFSLLFASWCTCAQKVSLTSQNTQGHPEACFVELMDQFPTVRDFSMNGDENEIYFSAQDISGNISIIMRSTRTSGDWTQPEIASFSGEFMDIEPFLSPDGKSIYFASSRPVEGAAKQDFDIWMCRRTSLNHPWSPPINLGSPINTNENEFYPAIASNGNIYYTGEGNASKGKDDIFLAKWNGKEYEKPISLSEAINSVGYEYNAYVAPDESFLLFGGYGRKDGFGSGDIYMSKKQMDGTWSTAENLGSKINSVQMDYCPFLDLKNNTLYFTSKRMGMKIPAGGFKSTNEFLLALEQFENGKSRIYCVDFNP